MEELQAENNASNVELLKFVVENGMLDLSYVHEQIKMQKREELLKKHKYKIWKGTDNNWHTYLPDELNGRTPRKRRELADLENLIVDYWKQIEENPTIEDIFNEWNDRRLSLEKISKASHLRNSQIFKRHFTDMGKRRIKATTKEDIGDFLEEQIPIYKLTTKAFSNLKGITKGFLKRAKKRKFITFNVEELFYDLDVTETEFTKKIKEDYEEVFSENEMPLVVDYLSQNLDMWNLGILLMFVSGARVGEVVALKHTDFEDNTFKIRRTETRYKDTDGYRCEVKEFPKTQAGLRTVIIPTDYEWIAKELKKLNPFGEYIFVRNGKRITTQCLRMRLKRVCIKLNIYEKSPHKIRKTYGTILLDNHVDKRLIMGQMGHSDILCTEKHYHRNRRSINVKASILSNLPDFKLKQG